MTLWKVTQSKYFINNIKLENVIFYKDLRIIFENILYIYIYNSEDVANYWVEKKQGLSSSTLLIIREWKIIIQIYMIKNNRQFDKFLQN